MAARLSSAAITTSPGTTSVSNGEADLIAPISDVGANVIISAGTLNLTGGGPAPTTGTLTMSAGTLTGSDTLTVSGSTEWTGGTMSGSWDDQLPTVV